jgi:chromate transporter
MSIVPAPPRRRLESHPTSVAALVRYFLRLGAAGFGGPIALVGRMQRDLVERERWITQEEYLQGLALAQLAPGPLAAQLAIYIGWVRGRLMGATGVAFAFVLPSFLMVLALSALYVRFGGLPWMAGVFYGVAPTAIAIVARGAYTLTRTTLARDAVAWAAFAVNAVVTAWSGREIVALVVLGGLATMVPRSRAIGGALAVAPPSLAWMLVGAHGLASAATLPALGIYFAVAGAIVFGSGLAIVPFLHAGVVGQHHWLTDRQFLDAVAVAMITPGPVVITVAFIGYLVAGAAGATISALGVVLPCYLFVVLLAPHYRRVAGSPLLERFIAGATAGTAGAIVGAVVVLARRAIVDVPSAMIGVAALALMLSLRRVPEPLLILLAGVVGWWLHRGASP